MSTVVFLVFMACIGPQCHEVGLGTYPSVQACVLSAFPAVAEWMGNHPSFTQFKTITCGLEPAQEGKET